MNKVMVALGPELFRFTDWNHWADTAIRAFKSCGVPPYDTICIDSAGRICTRGLHFQDATWPVIVYAVADRPLKAAAAKAREVK